MLKKTVATAILAALSIGFAVDANADTTPSVTSFGAPIQANASQDTTQSSSSTDQTTEENNAKKLDQVNVSGSLINNAQIQTATPTYTITAEEIKARGFNSVAEVLQNAVQSTGSVQGPQESGGFTQGAQTISLYGLAPEYTLLLLDGKPITNFGQLYNGQSNFNNISNIPISMVDHIDVIPGGASSIYGSSAIAGVVNIVTKQHMDGAEVTARAGGYSEGGGANQRITAGFGHQYGKLDVLSAFEFDNASPIWGYQRELTSGSEGNPNGLNTPESVVGVINYGPASTFNGIQQPWLAPPNGCGASSKLFGGSTVLTNDPIVGGQYCGSTKELGYTTYANQSRSYDGMLKLRYDISENVRLYTDILTDWQQQKWTQGSDFIFWEPLDQGLYLEDANTGNVVVPLKVFGPEEMPGGYTSQLNRQDDLMYQADIGANGQFGDSGWQWDVYFLRSGDKTTTASPVRLASAVDNFFVNKVLGGGPVGYDPNTGLNTWNINYAALYEPLTPQQFASFNTNISGVSNTWVNDTRATIQNSSLFSLPGGDAGFAFLLEGGNEAWYDPINPLIANGDIWGLTGDSGGGTRDHQAGAFEFNAPIFKMLTLDLSGRYDRYTINGGENNKFTYKAGLEFRPFDTWLLRANYSTSFRAPDMSSLFLGPSGFYETVQDPYQCALAHSNNCGSPDFQYQVIGELLSNPQLKPTTASSWNVGTVWSPINNLSVTVDYLHIDIANEVVQQDIPTLLREDSQCLLGQLDPSSSQCQQVTAQVQRNSEGLLTGITTYFANLASEQTNSITAQVKYAFPQTPIGTFSTEWDYNDMLKHSYQLVAGSAPINELTDSLYSTEFKSIVTGSVTWTWSKWSSTLYWHRDGSSPNYIAFDEGPNAPGAGRVGAWNTFNYSLTYSPSKQVDVSLLMNNAFNKMPPRDATYTAYPYFNTENYDVYGREIMLQADIRFGGAKSN
jgi:outer membrane receptor protein involved in Fe transport